MLRTNSGLTPWMRNATRSSDGNILLHELLNVFGEFRTYSVNAERDELLNAEFAAEQGDSWT